MRSRLYLSVLATLPVLIAGCQPALVTVPTQNVATLTVIYPLPKEQLADSMRIAMRRLPVSSDAYAQDGLAAVSTIPGMSAELRVSFSEDEQGLTTAVMTSEYIIRGSFQHLPMDLMRATNEMLGTCRGHVVPQAVYHAEAECIAPPKWDLPCRLLEPPQMVVVEQPPQPIGGLEAISNRVRFPREARRAGVEGQVWTEFVLDEEGAVRCAMVTSGLPGGPNEVALAAIIASRFTPGMQDGVPVKVRFTLPISFRLR